MANLPTNVNEETLCEESYQRVLPQLQALTAEELRQINLDINSAVSTTLGALPEIQALRPRIEKAVPEFNLEQFDQLEDYARALSYAHTQFVTACQGPDDLPALWQEGTSLRDTLHADAMALAQRGLINPGALKDLKGANGYKNLANDLQILVAVLKGSWSEIEGKCGAQPAELDRASKIAVRILRVVGLREQGPVLLAASTENRLRAFTLFSRAYDQARRAAIYLRWEEEDADKIAPSLYAGRGRRKAPEESSSELPPPVVATPAPATTTSPSTAAGTPASGAVNAANAVPVGLPGSEPFLQ